jgi:hypothetical protein
MDMNQVETIESMRIDAVRSRRLNGTVAISVALLATFLAICKVKDENIVQAMQQAQADKLDHWAYYQARNIRQDLAESTLLQLQLLRTRPGMGATADIDSLIQRQKDQVLNQQTKKAELKKQAEADQVRYDALNFRDDQFDLAEALLAVTLALLAVTALTQLWWLYWLSLVPTLGGVMMGLAGLLGWGLHPEALVRLLS